jgi:hypothetical protein
VKGEGVCLYNKGRFESYTLTLNNSFLRRVFQPLNGLIQCCSQYFFTSWDDVEEIGEEDFNLLVEHGLIGEGVVYFRGVSDVLLTVPHASEPLADYGVNNLVKNLEGCQVLLSTVSRCFFDYNNKFLHDNFYLSEVFNKKISELKREGVKVLLDIHSMEHRSYSDIDLCTAFGTASSDFITSMQSFLKSKGYNTTVNTVKKGGDIIIDNYKGVEAVEIEISRDLINQPFLIKTLNDLIKGLDL